MSHFSGYSDSPANPDGRALGDEWSDWDGRDGGTINEGRRLFLLVFSAVLLATDALFFFMIYMISPRLAGWASWLVPAAWVFASLFAFATLLWLVLVVTTASSGRMLLPGQRFAHTLFGFVFSGTFGLARIFGVSRDRVGNSFVKLSNAIARAAKTKNRNERLLLLLPRCLAKEELKAIGDLKQIYPVEVHTVSGGELARKKVREHKPTVVIGVACERDLVSGIRDVGQKIAVYGIPNKRPEGPCKNTHIDMDELVKTIEFFVGPAKPVQS